MRTEVEVEPTDSQEWLNLVEDSKPQMARRATRPPPPQNIVSRIEEFEIEHVELQTCGCGCRRCVLGDEDGAETSRSNSVGEHNHLHDDNNNGRNCPSCTRCRYSSSSVAPRSKSGEAPFQGFGCWRSAYRGSERHCKIKLRHSNALQHFRILVRARQPPPERRGYLRPKRCGPDPRATTLQSTSTSPKQQPSLSRRRRRWQRDSKPRPALGFGADPYSDDEVGGGSSPPPGYVFDPSDSLNGRDASRRGFEASLSHLGADNSSDDDDDNINNRRTGATPAVGDNMDELSSSSWFVSQPVFVDSRPPPVTLHGLGTALVITWSPLASFSGAERVSYMLEQWSRPMPTLASPHGVARGSGAGSDGGDFWYHRGKPNRRFHNRCRRSRTSPKEVKEVSLAPKGWGRGVGEGPKHFVVSACVLMHFVLVLV